MKTYTVSEFKACLSKILVTVQQGEEVAVTFGKKKEIVAYLIPKPKTEEKRFIGLLEGKANVIFASDFEMTEEEFLGLQ